MEELEQYKIALDLACELLKELGYTSCVVYPDCQHLDGEYGECMLDTTEVACDKSMAGWFFNMAEEREE